MNFKTTLLSSVFLFTIATMIYTPAGEAFAKKIYIVNNLDVPLIYKETKKRQDIQINSGPPKEVKPHTTNDDLHISPGDSLKNADLVIKYYVNNSDSGDTIGIQYNVGDGGSKHCPKDHPDWITEEVNHCGSWDNDNEWRYIFSLK